MGSLCWGAPQHRLMTRSSNEFPDMRIQYRISCNDWLQNRFPSIGAVHIAFTQRATFEVPKLFEHEQRVIAHAAEMAVPCRSFLRAVGLG